MKRIAPLFVIAFILSLFLFNCNSPDKDKDRSSSPERIAKKYIEATCEDDEDAIDELIEKGNKIMEDMTDEEKEEWNDEFNEAIIKEVEDLDDDCLAKEELEDMINYLD